MYLDCNSEWVSRCQIFSLMTLKYNKSERKTDKTFDLIDFFSSISRDSTLKKQAHPKIIIKKKMEE